MAASKPAVDAAATTLLSEVTPAVAELSGRLESLQQRQSALMQTLQDCSLVDEVALAKVETAIGQVLRAFPANRPPSCAHNRALTVWQIPAYHAKLETLQGDMLNLARRTASMRQRSANLAAHATRDA